MVSFLLKTSTHNWGILTSIILGFSTQEPKTPSQKLSCIVVIRFMPLSRVAGFSKSFYVSPTMLMLKMHIMWPLRSHLQLLLLTLHLQKALFKSISLTLQSMRQRVEPIFFYSKGQLESECSNYRKVAVSTVEIKAKRQEVMAKVDLSIETARYGCSF